MTRGKRSSLAALTINAKHAEKRDDGSNGCAAIFCNSFIMDHSNAERRFRIFQYS